MRTHLIILTIIVCFGCKKNVKSPSVTTNGVTALTNISARSGGTVSNDYGKPITARGVVWSTSPNPTVVLSTKTVDSLGVGNFTSTITGLNMNTTYYVKAYATNSAGTFYGNEIVFTTLNVDITSGLVAYYPFNGNANDESGNSNNGSVMGSVISTADRLGKSNKAYSFPGRSDSYINCGSSNSLMIRSAITMSAWILLDGGYLNPRVLNYGNEGSGTNYQISMSGSSNASRFIDGGLAMTNGTGSFFCCGPSGNGVSIPALTWQHIAITVDSLGATKFYTNGQLSKSIQGTPVNENNYVNTILNIGRKNQNAYDAYGGKIDEVRIYKRALTADQIAYLYNQDF